MNSIKKDYNGLVMGAFEEAFVGEKHLAFEPQEYKDRLNKLRGMMAKAGIDMMWLTTPESVCWLHGYYASWYKANSPMRYPQCYGTAVHVDHDEILHFDNPTEMPILAAISVCENLYFFSSRDAADNIPFVMNELSSRGWLSGTVGMEKWSYLPNPAISAMFEGAFLTNGARVVDGSALPRGARLVKSPAEIAKIEMAAGYVDIGWQAILKEIRPGMTELDLFGLTTAAMMKAGSEFSALIPIFNTMPVRDGRAISTGHAMAGRRVIEAGQFLCGDICGVHDRYHANAMRGVYLGDPPAAMANRYRRAARVFDLFRTEVKSGMTVREVNALIKLCLAENGLDGGEGWVLGYELGLSLPPDWVGDFYFHYQDTKYLDRVFEENMVTNLESLFNTWLIDTVVYTPNGCRILSKTPLELMATG
ncbi:M24 family metallopeptidase [Aestuariivirga sp.]|uniref:M24 family metallopeptidase n=1 Tax=Aestuariivirga sp. TaxID=2650926 RepID=UPI0039E50A14